MSEHQMELGNMVFGNSRGEFPVPRHQGYEEPIRSVLDACGCDGHGYPGFENDTFVVRPYYWGDCTCGWDELEFDGPHDHECYRTLLIDLRKKHGSLTTWGGPDYYSVDIIKGPYADERTDLCIKMGLNPDLGCETHCTCDYDDRYLQWYEENKIGEDGHADDCPSTLPNFHHKPSGYKLKWYKYPLRDSYANQQITLSEFRAIMDKCLRSLP